MLVAVAIAAEDVAVLDVADAVSIVEVVDAPNRAAMVIALSEPQHSLLSAPQHHVFEVAVPSQGVIRTLSVLLPLFYPTLASGPPSAAE